MICLRLVGDQNRDAIFRNSGYVGFSGLRNLVSLSELRNIFPKCEQRECLFAVSIFETEVGIKFDFDCDFADLHIKSGKSIFLTPDDEIYFLAIGDFRLGFQAIDENQESNSMARTTKPPMCDMTV